MFFFFQAEDGIRDLIVTGVQTCALPIYWRSALIVVATIPFALLSAVVALWGAGQTVNIMTLGGLALAVGIRSEEHTSELQSRSDLVCRLLLEKKKKRNILALLMPLRVNTCGR